MMITFGIQALRSEAIKHSGEGDGLADVREAADPRHRPLQPDPEARVLVVSFRNVLPFISRALDFELEDTVCTMDAADRVVSSVRIVGDRIAS